VPGRLEGWGECAGLGRRPERLYQAGYKVEESVPGIVKGRVGRVR
jgi:hypothetical protein